MAWLAHLEYFFRFSLKFTNRHANEKKKMKRSHVLKTSSTVLYVAGLIAMPTSRTDTSSTCRHVRQKYFTKSLRFQVCLSINTDDVGLVYGFVWKELECCCLFAVTKDLND